MISRVDALRLTESAFPKGPESLASHLEIPHFSAPIQGFEGWCAHAKNTIIVVNSNSTKSRQRFTLAHELAHLILGTESDIYCQPFQSNRAEERAADALAAQLLIPFSKLISFGANELPVVGKTIDNISKAAQVSPIVTACRVVDQCSELGLKNAAIVYLANGEEKWRFSSGLTFITSDAVQLANNITAGGNGVVRVGNHDGNVIVGSLIDQWDYELLLVQLLPPEIATREAKAELIERIRKQVFKDDRSFEGRVAGCLSSIGQKRTEIGKLEQAMACFREKYLPTFTPEQQSLLSSDDGCEFLRFRLSKWFDS